MSQPKILILHGPNINMLGERESEIYGSLTLNELDDSLESLVDHAGFVVETFQTNHEGLLVEKIQQARNEADFIVINPSGYHRSLALRDALLAVEIPFIEVHLSNIHAREPFRRESLIADIALGVINGFGPDGYHWAVMHAIRYLKEEK